MADSAYRGPIFSSSVKREKLRLGVVTKKKCKKGFEILPWRWVVERSFGWLEGARRLAKDHEILSESAEAWIAMRFTQIIIRRITKNN